MKDLAPVCVSTYIRLEHLKKTIEALSQNKHALESELFVFSDGPREGDESKVEKVREYLSGIDGFKSVNVISRVSNDRVYNNREGLRDVLNKYGRCVFLEDDIVTAPGFIGYMNSALDKYENNPSVMSITGYCPPITIPSEYSHDIFALNRFCSWGFAIWKDRYDMIKYLDEDDFKSIDAKKISKFGEDIYGMVRSDFLGHIDALDVKAMFCQYQNDMATIYPKYSFVQNIGHDGSGIHCGITKKFSHQSLWNKTEGFVFPDEVVIDRDVVNCNYNFRRITFKEKLYNFYIKHLKAG